MLLWINLKKKYIYNNNNNNKRLTSSVSDVPQVEVKMTSSPASIIEGDAFSLRCDVKRSNPPPLKYLWKKDETEIGHERSLSVNPIKLKDGGLYTCSATNTAGTGTSAAHEIKVQCKFHSICAACMSESP